MDFEKQMREGIRNSKMAMGEVFFWTDTIKNWSHLLANDRFKEIIISSWQYLVLHKKIAIYGYVIMPNHLHVIWEMLEMNGKESPYASFNKFSSHQFKSELILCDPSGLESYKEVANDRAYRFWQRDPLAIWMDSRAKLEQKLNYIHLNPLQEKWSLVLRPEDYRWSSASFYQGRSDEFGLVTHYKDRF
jgi:putative transposase